MRLDETSKNKSQPIIIENKKKGVYKNLISGGIAASVGRTITNPIERVEILRQVENIDFKGMNLKNSFIKVYKTQGIPGFFKGNTASVVRIFPFSAIEFYSLESFKNLFIRGKENQSFFFNFLCGGLAGLTAATFTFPLDVARTRISINTENSHVKETSITVSMINLWKVSGIKGLYKGYSVAAIGTMFYIAIKQSCFELFQRKFMINKYKNYLNLIYGSLAGIIGTLIMYPFYMIKRVFQANNSHKFEFVPYFKDLIARHGIKGFYLGLSMTLLKTGPFVGITFLCNEKMKEFLKY